MKFIAEVVIPLIIAGSIAFLWYVIIVCLKDAWPNWGSWKW